MIVLNFILKFVSIGMSYTMEPLQYLWKHVCLMFQQGSCLNSVLYIKSSGEKYLFLSLS